jgi:hypothetical protein
MPVKPLIASYTPLTRLLSPLTPASLTPLTLVALAPLKRLLLRYQCSTAGCMLPKNTTSSQGDSMYSIKALLS